MRSAAPPSERLPKRSVDLYPVFSRLNSGNEVALLIKFVFVPEFIKNLFTPDVRSKFGAEQKRARHLTMERVSLLWWWGQTMAKHDGKKIMNPACGILVKKVERFVWSKRLSEDHHGVDMRIDHHLSTEQRLLPWRVNRVLKCDVITLPTFPFEPLNLVMWYTQLLQERVQNLKSLALMKVKIEKFEVLHSPILISFI